MTIVRLKKYLFLGVQEDIDTFFSRAQAKGFIEFVSDKGRRAADYPENVEKLIRAIKILKKEPVEKAPPLTKDLDATKLADTVVETAHYLEKLEEEKRMLEGGISRIHPLGDFDLEEIRSIEQESGRHVQFFCLKKAKLKTLEIDPSLIHVGSEYDMDYFMTLSKGKESFQGMIEMHIEKSLSQLEEELENVKENIKRCYAELKEDAAYIDFLKEHLTEALNGYHLKSASSSISTHMNDALFAIEGWVPENRLHSLFPLLEGLGIHAEEVAVEKEDRIPTCMENRSYGKVGEDLVHIYDTPSTNDKDPSIWVFWAFSLFFAMIISDAGYGALFLAAALFLRWKFKHAKPSGKRFFRLFTMLGAFCIGWGILSGAYFGMEISPENPINKVNIIHALAIKKADYHIAHKDETYEETVKDFPQLAGVTNGKTFLYEGMKIGKNGEKKYVVSDDFRDAIFMEIALIVGVIHIALSLLRQTRRSLAGIGWVVAMVGAYMFFPRVLGATSIVHFVFLIPKATSFAVGAQLFWGGMGVAFLIALIQNKWGGFIELTKLIELFADVLSYLRIYALGLAAMILAGTFNTMGADAGLVGGFLIILVGHLMNITVGIMGGTIHGLRLNFIEWYHHSFEGGGKLFNPLKLIKSGE